MIPVLVCFSGRIGSGKTTISRAVAEALNCPYVSFGDYVRSVAMERGLDPADRAVLAAIGESLIETLGWEKFCRSVLIAAQWSGNTSLVVDGIRHVSAFETIRGIASPTPSFLMHLDLEDGTSRVARQTGKGVLASGATDLHSTEREVAQLLPQLASLVLSAEEPVDVLTSQVLGYLSAHSTTQVR